MQKKGANCSIKEDAINIVSSMVGKQEEHVGLNISFIGKDKLYKNGSKPIQPPLGILAQSY